MYVLFVFSASTVFYQDKRSSLAPTTPYEDVCRHVVRLFTVLTNIPFVLAKLDPTNNFHQMTPPPRTAKDVKSWQLPGGGGNRSKIWIIPQVRYVPCLFPYFWLQYIVILKHLWFNKTEVAFFFQTLPYLISQIQLVWCHIIHLLFFKHLQQDMSGRQFATPARVNSQQPAASAASTTPALPPGNYIQIRGMLCVTSYIFWQLTTVGSLMDSQSFYTFWYFNKCNDFKSNIWNFNHFFPLNNWKLVIM